MGQDAEGNKENENENDNEYDYEIDNGENDKNATRNLPPYWFVVKNLLLISTHDVMIII